MMPTPVPPDVRLIGERHCPKCGYTFTAVGTGDGRPASDPTPGDFTVCMKCIAVLVFDSSMALRELTTEELWRLTREEVRDLSNMKGRIAYMHRVCGPPGGPVPPMQES
jgi:hypothetical protein